jgi:molybdopterin molybdotransferase
MAGQLGTSVVLGLPGNPVSAFVTALLFARPLIAAFSGSAACVAPLIPAPLAAPLNANSGARVQFLRGHWVDGGVAPLDDQDSAGLTALAEATLLIRRAADAPVVAAGDMVEILAIA